MFIGEQEAVRSVEDTEFINFYSYKGPDFNAETKVVKENLDGSVTSPKNLQIKIADIATPPPNNLPIITIE